MTPSFAALVAEARRRGLAVEPLGWRDAVRLTGPGGEEAWLMGTLTSRTSHLAVLLAGNKHATKVQLARAGLPTLEGVLCRRPDEAAAAFARLGGAVVVKPNLGAQGAAVRTDLRDADRVAQACALALRQGGAALVERHAPGRDLRLLVVDGRVAAASERLRPQVLGDGRATVRELVAALNADPRRRPGHEGALTRVELDDEVLDHLDSQDLAPDQAPGPERVVTLSHTANLSRGGLAVDVTDTVAPRLREVAEAAARAVGLDVAGVDLIADDLVRPSRLVVLEVNASPGLRMHLLPSGGEPRDVARPIIASLFPEEG